MSRTIGDLIENRNQNNSAHRSENGNGRRVNISTFFMQLTYSADPYYFQYLFKNSTEIHRRRLEFHVANTQLLIRQYFPYQYNKMNQFRCCVRTNRYDQIDFANLDDKPLDELDPGQVKCSTSVIVIARDQCSESKWGNSAVSYLLSFLNKKHLYPTCISFRKDDQLNNLIKELNQLHALTEKINVHDTKSTTQAKQHLVMSTLAKLLQSWSISILILDICSSNMIDLHSVVQFASRFQIKIIDMDNEGGSGKQDRATAKRIGAKVQKAVLNNNLTRIKNGIDRNVRNMIAVATTKTDKFASDSTFTLHLNPTLTNDDCRRIIMSLYNNMALHLPTNTTGSIFKATSKTNLLADGISTDLELEIPAILRTRSKSGQKTKVIESSYSSDRDRGSINSCRRPATSCSPKSEDDFTFQPIFVTSLTRDQDKVSELMFDELNQRWRIHGPPRYIPLTPGAGPNCGRLVESEKQLIHTAAQEVTNFEALKDIRNELKDSKKDLEGRLYGYNPDFSSLIASAEEFLHGKASSLEASKEEIEYYKLPVSLLYSEMEVKYMKAKPPMNVITGESCSQTIKFAVEESTKLFLDAVIQTACGCRKIPLTRRNRTKAVVVIEDNNEVLELLTVALWFFDKTPLATFQTKYCHNSEDLQLSLDACRFYLEKSTTKIANKDERLFEKWIGVGLTNIIRSLQYRVILIDLPRPGVSLKETRSILFKRLKIEESLHNIKSFIVGKPSRKEDNLSTVENVLDEIQSCLDPRDKLLFRKARRIYLDLKLYKQIEQKSRQDLKAFREWGIPEPDDDHGFLEALKNSELVVNAVDSAEVHNNENSDVLSLVSSTESMLENRESTLDISPDDLESEVSD